jgi:hypothetical protein
LQGKLSWSLYRKRLNNWSWRSTQKIKGREDRVGERRNIETSSHHTDGRSHGREEKPDLRRNASEQ